MGVGSSQPARIWRRAPNKTWSPTAVGWIAGKLAQLLEEAGTAGEGLNNLLTDLGKQASPLDDLTGGGDGQVANESDFWPVIRLQVSPDTYRAFTREWDQLDGSDDDKLRTLLARPVE